MSTSLEQVGQRTSSVFVVMELNRWCFWVCSTYSLSGRVSKVAINYRPANFRTVVKLVNAIKVSTDMGMLTCALGSSEKPFRTKPTSVWLVLYMELTLIFSLPSLVTSSRAGNRRSN